MFRLLVVLMLCLVAQGVHAQQAAPDPLALEAQPGNAGLPPVTMQPQPPPRLTLDAYEGQLRWQLASLAQQEDDIREAGGYGRRKFRIVGGFVGGGIGLGAGLFTLAVSALVNGAGYDDEYDDPDQRGVGLAGGIVGGMLLAGGVAGIAVAIVTLTRPAPFREQLRDTRRARVETMRELKRVTVERRQLELSVTGSGLRLAF